MLTHEELDRVDKYLYNNYCPTKSDIAYFNAIDDFIIDCSMNEAYCKENADKLKELSEEVHRKLCAMFILEDFSPRTLLYQEKYYELNFLDYGLLDSDIHTFFLLLAYFEHLLYQK